MPINDSKWWTMKDVCRELQVSPGTVRQLIADGKLRVVKVGLRGLFRIPRASVAEYLAEQWVRKLDQNKGRDDQGGRRHGLDSEVEARP